SSSPRWLMQAPRPRGCARVNRVRCRPAPRSPQALAGLERTTDFGAYACSTARVDAGWTAVLTHASLGVDRSLVACRSPMPLLGSIGGATAHVTCRVRVP